MKWFCTHKNISPISVRLPNGTLVSAEHAGDVLLNNSIVLHDVLYLPMFDFNLLSISKLTKALNYFVSFSGESCLIQDSSKRMIGSGKIHNGLYLLQQHGNSPDLNSIQFCNSVSVSTSDCGTLDLAMPLIPS